ncbi:reverse transcriptase [Tanacetum coccineum]
MVVSTRNALLNSSNGSPLVLDDETKRFLAETIAGMLEGSLATMQRLINNITALSLQNQQMGNRGSQVHHSRLAKIEFSKFFGDDVKGWVFRCEKFFLIEQTPEKDKVTLISIYLYDKALLWHSQFVRTHGNNVTWNVYKQAILTRLGNGYDDPMSELKNLKYKTTAKEYKDAFDNLLSRVEPKTLADAYCLEILQEATLNAVKKKNKAHFTLNNSRYNSGSTSTFKPLMTTTNNASGHKCSGQLYSLVLVPEDENEGDGLLYEDKTLVDHGLMDLQAPLISLNALTGTTNFKTMRVFGTVGKHTIHILIDCGSTKNIGCHIRNTCPLAVTVADGNNLVTTSECKQFKWQFGPTAFTTDVMLLPLGGCEMVLGIQWLETLGDIRFNFQELRMDFKYNGSYMQLEVASVTSTHPMLQQVIEAYKDVFDVPTELPPKRAHDHGIPLVEGALPVNIRPYRHPPTQKDAIEGMVAELSEAGVIKKSNPLLFSPIVMVKKKDNSWRMCVDYRQLNKQTIKDKFPIPIIEELIDELHGS